MKFDSGVIARINDTFRWWFQSFVLTSLDIRAGFEMNNKRCHRLLLWLQRQISSKLSQPLFFRNVMFRSSPSLKNYQNWKSTELYQKLCRNCTEALIRMLNCKPFNEYKHWRQSLELYHNHNEDGNGNGTRQDFFSISKSGIRFLICGVGILLEQWFETKTEVHSLDMQIEVNLLW